MNDEQEKFKHLRSFAEELPPRGSRFVAVGSQKIHGAQLFSLRQNGDIYDASGEAWAPSQTDDDVRTVFADLCYSHWIALPEDFKFWGEA